MAITPNSDRLAGWLKPPLQGFTSSPTELMNFIKVVVIGCVNLTLQNFLWLEDEAR